MTAQQKAQACMKNAEQCRAEALEYAAYGYGAGGDWLAAEKLAEAREWDERAANWRKQCRGKFDPTPSLFTA